MQKTKMHRIILIVLAALPYHPTIQPFLSQAPVMLLRKYGIYEPKNAFNPLAGTSLISMRSSSFLVVVL